VTWWGVFGLVAGGLVVGSLVAAALLDRRARSRGFRYHPEMGRSLRRHRGELNDRRAAALLRSGRRRSTDPGYRNRGERHP
jgi:hypothetical protein